MVVFTALLFALCVAAGVCAESAPQQIRTFESGTLTIGDVTGLDLNDIRTPGFYVWGSPFPAHSPISTDRSNPLYGTLIVTGNQQASIVYQLVIDFRGNLYTRTCGVNGWEPWSQSEKRITESAQSIDTYQDGMFTIGDATGLDLNDIKASGFYTWAKPFPAHSPIPFDRSNPLYGALIVVSRRDKTVTHQLVFDYRGNIYVRTWGAVEGWTTWTQAARGKNVVQEAQASTTEAQEAPSAAPAAPARPLAAKAFARVGCIGDSYTAGFINIGSKAGSYPECSWPHYMEALTGSTWTNFGVGGSSCKSWIEGGRYSGLDRVRAEGNKCQAYVIGLMINDSSPDKTTYVVLGTPADIGTQNDSYYAYYYRLILSVHEVNELAPIFCNTCPKSLSRYTGYNEAVRTIVAYCQDQGLPVYLCDLAGEAYNTPAYYANEVFTTDYINGHYTAIGYEMMAECYLRVMSDVMLDHISGFQNIHLIPYDKPQ